MKAAIVLGAGQVPVYADFREPSPQAGESRITVTAAAISPVVKGRAAGTHYSATNQFPFIAGIDGVGRTKDGRRVYFVAPRAPFGSMAERTLAPADFCVPVPDAVDDIMAAALANPGMSSWAAYRFRAGLKAGETVLVNGATGVAGRLAIQIAKHLGAGKVIATGRNTEALNGLKALGADAVIQLSTDEQALEQSFKAHFAQGVNVVIDYLWGKSAECLLIAGAKAAPDAAPIRFVQVGSASGADITLPSAVLRGSAIALMGSGLGSVALAGMARAIGELLEAAIPAGLDIATQAVPLADVERVWNAAGSRARTVLIPAP